MVQAQDKDAAQWSVVLDIGKRPDELRFRILHELAHARAWHMAIQITGTFLRIPSMVLVSFMTGAAVAGDITRVLGLELSIARWVWWPLMAVVATVIGCFGRRYFLGIERVIEWQADDLAKGQMAKGLPPDSLFDRNRGLWRADDRLRFHRDGAVPGYLGSIALATATVGWVASIGIPDVWMQSAQMLRLSAIVWGTIILVIGGTIRSFPAPRDLAPLGLAWATAGLIGQDLLAVSQLAMATFMTLAGVAAFVPQKARRKL